MIGQVTTRSLTKLTDFSKFNAGYTYTTNTVLTDAQYTFDTTTRAFRAKKAIGISNKLNVSFKDIGISELHFGDIIEVSLQCKNISGDKFRIGIDSSAVLEEAYVSTNNNEWETMNIKHIIRSEIDATHPSSDIAMGLWSAMSGEFAVRDIIIKITTKADNSFNKIIEKGSNANGHYSKYADGSMECWGTTDFASLVLGTAWGAIFTHSTPVAITYPIPFTSVESRSLVSVTLTASAWLRGDAFSTTNCSLYFDRAVSTVANSYRVAWGVKGRWRV